MENIKALLNETYAALEEKRRELVRELEQGGFSVGWGFYSGHYHRNDRGVYEMDHYPIPVISVAGICDIEVEPDHLNLSAKLSRERALADPFEVLAGHPFETYGVENYTEDFFLPGMTAAEMKEKISRSSEGEIGFAFPFPADVEGKTICEFVGLLRREGFYD